MKSPGVYLLASQKNGTLYIGFTSNLIQRVHQHRTDAMPGFTNNDGVHRLVWFEQHATMESAILYEKRIKHWKRAWKIELIDTGNAEWRDLFDSIAA